DAQFAELVRALRATPWPAGGAAALAAAQRAALGVQTPAAITARAVAWPEEAGLAGALRAIAARGSPKAAEKAGRLLDWLGLPGALRAESWAAWREEFLRADGEARGAGVFVNARLAATDPGLAEACLAEQARVQAIEDAWRARAVAEASAALVLLAEPVLALYASGKAAGGWLDYDDLITRTAGLLVDPGAAWVLYKLDGGIDHLLLDEVQDTAPAQWRIAAALTAEFFAGSGAREGGRTVFAVGDRKQSIFAFQGADPAQFEHWRGVLRARVEAAGQQWRDVALDVSFRSTAPVLALADAVFDDPLAGSGVAGPGTLTNFADRAAQAGRVELWPLTPRPVAEPPAPWAVAGQNRGSIGAPQRLAEAIGDWIAAQVGHAELPGRGRRLAPGDILILVRRRNELGRALVRALKLRGVPVAGLDRMVLTEQPAVADCLALCDALLMPQDDLTLACVLTSPLGGVSDEALMALATGRAGSLWEALRARAGEPDYAGAHHLLATLLARVDYASPHALLVEALGALGGRARLFARLGPEAAEPVSELLDAALRYAARHPPSLQGFLHWLRQSGAEVKREAEGAAGEQARDHGRGQVRIMTVHGAKGLQAPLVILPDTTGLPREDAALVHAGEVPLWSPHRGLRCAAVDTLRAAAARRVAEEQNRLLYVALTRAEDRLVVCGAQTARALPETCWYESVRRGFDRLAARPEPFAPWPGEVLALDSPQLVPPEPARAGAAAAPAALPGWAGTAPDWRA
ncbi:MAG: UvrD-helicase domain-containing protein, partial [Rhodospirillales bacterium]|nr:UvrD-helicase domain-containing protein [Rhodospirillales bacterium]